MIGNEMLVPYIVADRQREARAAARARIAREARRKAASRINRSSSKSEEFVVATGAGAPVMVSLCEPVCP